ncbi:hypothetical protein [Serratia quinivorans]|jgi:hypothetical protein|uniref:hypothetical protein n=1 Tax=Serratia quinivorans TaxID=137545 RepID=UPI000DD4745B|nr:hypothetical protein [Serratia quinivorans]
MNDVYITINANADKKSNVDSNNSTLTVVPQRRESLIVAPHSSVRDVLYNGSGIIPEVWPNVSITNEGPAQEITAEYFWAAFIGAWTLYTSVKVKVGETKVLSSPLNATNYSMIKITNDTKRQCFVTAETM